MSEGLRARVRAGEVVLGAFIKTASHHVGEILGRVGLDFAVVDAEHAPFDIAAIDRVVLGAASAGLPCLVRPPDHRPSFIGQCLDLDAAGVLVPHVASAPAALGVASAARYGLRERGFSPSTRAGGYGAGDAAAYRARADAETSIWCQIEDAEVIARLEAIAAVEAVDCLFIGPADLALSLEIDSPRDPKLTAAIEEIARVGRAAGRAVGIYVGDPAQIPPLLALGITVFICGSDQSFMLAEGRRTRAAFDAAVAGTMR